MIDVKLYAVAKCYCFALNRREATGLGRNGFYKNFPPT
jgi:hypothetical protein